VAKRLEAELGDEQSGFLAGDASDWDLLPLPEGSFKVGIDGGYMRNWVDKKRNFEVIVGKSTRLVTVSFTYMRSEVDCILYELTQTARAAAWR
jgi:hypothetical protein